MSANDQLHLFQDAPDQPNLHDYDAVDSEIGHGCRLDVTLQELQQAVEAGEQPARVASWTM